MIAVFEKIIMKRKETWVFLGFSGYPFLLFIAKFIDPNFMQIKAASASLSFLEFFSSIELTQFQLILPVIAWLYLINTVFHEEIAQKTMFIYKGLDRVKLLNAKLIAILGVGGLYLMLTLLASFLTYYTYLIQMPYATGTLFPRLAADLAQPVLEIIGVQSGYLICTLIAIVCSLKFNPGITMVAGIFFVALSLTAPHLKQLRYFLPSSYPNLLPQFSFVQSLIIMLGLTLAYCFIAYFWACALFQKVEY